METETGNAQMLLGCLLLVVQDSAALEVIWVHWTHPYFALLEWVVQNFCNRPILFGLQLKRMYAKLAPHSPAPTPARVDARECGLSFEKVADINSSDLVEYLLYILPTCIGISRTAFVCTLCCQEAELRQSDGYSENSARNSGNIFAAGQLKSLLPLMQNCMYNIILGFNFTFWAFSIHFIDFPLYPPKIPLMKMSFLKRVKYCTKSPKEPSHLTCFSQTGLSYCCFTHVLRLSD